MSDHTIESHVIASRALGRETVAIVARHRSDTGLIFRGAVVFALARKPSS